ncbi:MAG: Rpn family recombination-promoting nuclease/putative transposase [Rikenellaceae bacterium]
MTKSYIRFDWAMKSLLRNKANFGILEGFLTTLLNERIIIKNLLESESNQETSDDKQNRVDLLAENSKGELIIIEVQGNDAYEYYFQKLFLISKLVSEFINAGTRCGNIKKIYCINILYFSLILGDDIIYHGKSEFKGIHNNDLLKITSYQQQKFNIGYEDPLYPEYYILKIHNFNKTASTHLEEWISYIKTDDISDASSAPGLDEVREKFDLDKLSRKEYSRYQTQVMDNYSFNNNFIWQIEEADFNGYLRGLEEAREECYKERVKQGIEQGRKESSLIIARNLKSKGFKADEISQITGLLIDEVNNA